MKERPYEPEFTLYPDPETAGGFVPRGKHLSEQLSIYGVQTVLDGARIRLKDEPLMDHLSGIRRLIESTYGNATRYGEAFEDGAVCGTLMALRSVGHRLMPVLERKVGSLIDACEREYCGYPNTNTVIFSEPRMNLVNALRDEGTSGYANFHRHITPIAAHITLDKYETDPEYVEIIGQGVGFVLNQLKWAHGEDFTDFAAEYEAAQGTFVGREGLKEELARQAIHFLSLQPSAET